MTESVWAKMDLWQSLKSRPQTLDVLVGRRGDEQRAVGGDVHGQHWQLVAVQAALQLEAVQEQHLQTTERARG